jgi:hypothetical protein
MTEDYRFVTRIDQRKIPGTLFKYRQWENLDLVPYEKAFGRRVLTEREIYFPSPDQFNDPFDGTLPFKYKKKQLTPENVFLKLVEIFTQSHPEKSISEIHAMCYKRQHEGGFDSDKYWRDNHKNHIKVINESFGILSLATKRDNILMWSHYADAHQGYCVGLDTNMLYETQQIQIGKVIYSDRFPVKPSRKIGQLSFVQFCKFKLFNYEKEKLHRKQNPFDHQAV